MTGIINKPTCRLVSTFGMLGRRCRRPLTEILDGHDMNVLAYEGGLMLNGRVQFLIAANRRGKFDGFERKAKVFGLIQLAGEVSKDTR